MAIGPQHSDATSNWWYPQYPYYPSPQPYPHNMGWSCPRCGRVWAPNISSCDCQYRSTWTFNITTTKGYDVGTDIDLALGVTKRVDDDDDDEPQGAPV